MIIPNTEALIMIVQYVRRLSNYVIIFNIVLNRDIDVENKSGARGRQCGYTVFRFVFWMKIYLKKKETRI